ncbi:MAG: hypothetical protein QXD72_02445 [Candidatus Aenigmatarchaeota archaeon]
MPRTRDLERILTYAREYASRGDVSVVEFYLEEARELASESGYEIPKATLLDIEQTAYRNGIEARLADAREHALRGDVGTVEFYLRRARMLASKLGYEIPKATLRDIKRTAYRNRNK